MTEAIGWIGSFMLAVCGFPQAWLSWKQGHSDGVSKGLLWLWGGGELLTLWYVVTLKSAPLTFNYVCNIFAIAVIAWYKLSPRK